MKIFDKILKLKNNYSNINNKIMGLLDKKIYLIDNHPVNTLKNNLEIFYQDNNIFKSDLQKYLKKEFIFNIENNPIVNKFSNFDSLMIKENHVSSNIIRK